jgi:hypothetical protein
MGNANELSTDCAETSVDDGIAYIEAASPLTRLHYFDGKFLKADALSQEQEYHRTRVRLSNQAGGWGVVHGLGIDVIGNQLNVTGGLAITPAGNFVMNVAGVQADLAELLKVAEKAPPEGNEDFQPCVTDLSKGKGGTVASGLQIYEITVGPIDTLCGNEPVYGKLCESACVSDSRQPYWREGMVLRLRPINLKLPSSTTPLTSAHLRNRIASAYFTLEPGSTSDLLSRAGLQGGGWCDTASLYGRDEVAIGLLVNDGGAIKFDSWSARRERMDSQARGFWQGRMAMRPWNVYLAQILQFQCQLSGLLQDPEVLVSPADGCDDLRTALDKARKEIEILQKKYASSAKKMVERFAGKMSKADTQWAIDEVKGSSAELFELSDSLSKLDVGTGALPSNRLLFNSGFQQLPPAGYLPINPGTNTVSEQLDRMFGEGVRVHLRAARADVLPHLLEEAQHMERISLTRGLDNPKDLEDVEVFIPDGQIETVAAQDQGIWWQTTAVSSVTALLGALDDMEGSKGKDGRSPDQATGTYINQSYIDRGYASLDTIPQQDGVTRTEARDDGSFALTAVLSIDLLDEQAAKLDAIEEELAQAAAPAAEASAAPAAEAAPAAPAAAADAAPAMKMRMKREETAPPTPHVYTPREREVATYVAADMATDPFTLAVGEDTNIKLEWVTLMASGSRMQAKQIRVSGDLTVARVVKRGGKTTLLVHLDVTGTQIAYEGGKQEPSPINGSIRLALQRQGDGRTGLFLLDDARFNPDTPAVEVDWDSSPQTATVSLLTTSATAIDVKYAEGAASEKILSLLEEKGLASHQKIGASRIKSGYLLNDAGTDSTDQQRDEVLQLAALPAMPAISSATGAAAINALTVLSDFMDDVAFLARARARLFPQPKSARSNVTALHDWVMFRRMRPNFCCEEVVQAPAASVEAFQVWHLKVDTRKELLLVLRAMKEGNDEIFSKFTPKRVGVLRYQDDNTTSEEPPARVLAMWKQAKPGSQVAFARVWETTPERGQGWQNHARLREMLDEISLLTKPPVAGTGAIAALKEAPGPLADGTTDGGMLVVTLDVEDVKTIPHRVVMLPNTLSTSVFSKFAKDTEQGWTNLLTQISSAAAGQLPIEDLIVNFTDGKLDEDSVKALIVSRQSMADKLAAVNNGAQVVGRYALRLTSKVPAADVHPLDQHKAIMDALQAILVPGMADHFDVAATNLGSGAQVLSLIFFDINPVTGPA